MPKKLLIVASLIALAGFAIGPSTRVVGSDALERGEEAACCRPGSCMVGNVAWRGDGRPMVELARASMDAVDGAYDPRRDAGWVAGCDLPRTFRA